MEQLLGELNKAGARSTFSFLLPVRLQVLHEGHWEPNLLFIYTCAAPFGLKPEMPRAEQNPFSLSSSPLNTVTQYKGKKLHKTG